MTTTPTLIPREGVISFHDASLSIWEDSMPGINVPNAYKVRDAWELLFKRQVFARIVQTLNRLGWTVTMPAIKEHDVKHYSARVARHAAQRHRDCFKGDLKGELEISGRTIKFEMWQGVNTPTRPDHGGRYESNKEACMPYVLRLEMERTRRRIRDYLCNVFTDYTMSTYRPSKRAQGETAIESISRHWAQDQRSTPDKWEAYARKKAVEDVYNNKARDGVIIQHGQKVYTTDFKGRWLVGLAYADGGMWYVVTGPYTYERKCSNEITTTPPPDLRVKANKRRAREQLERELQKAVAAMDFKRAAVLKGVLFPEGPLYAIWSKKNNSYFAIMYAGYRDSLAVAGKYTRAELRPYLGDKLETEQYKAVPVAA